MSFKTNYNKRKWSGVVNKKKVEGQLKRFHGEECKSRLSAWGRAASTQETDQLVGPHEPEEMGLDPCTSSLLTSGQAANMSSSQETDEAVRPYDPEEMGLDPCISRPWKQKQIKTYKRLRPAYRKEATFAPSSQITTEPVVQAQAVNINWPLPDPAVESHELQVEVVQSEHLSGLTGYRIVDIKHVLQWAFNLEKHKETCTGATIDFVNEQRHGLQSTFIFKCLSCGKMWNKCSEKDPKINKSFVWGTVTAGSYYTQTEHLTSIMDIPAMSAATFRKMEKHLGDVWLEHLTEQIQQAGQEEKAIAIAKGNIDDDGVPFITVHVDGGWPKRTYGHNYNSASGMACIIGHETKKCLYLGVKNKYCFYCHYHEKKDSGIPSHQCFKNFAGPSTSMEAAILVEGFKKSEDMHGVRYLAFIGDGDSSVFAQLKENVPYGKTIKKFECKNHILSNTKLPLAGRNMLKPKLTRLTIVARKIIMHNAKNPNEMRKDLKNGPLHVFGQHTDCRDYYCKFKAPTVSPAPDEEQVQEDLVEKIKKNATTVWALIIAANEAVMAKAGRLSNETTNVAENFMSVINKFNCGKRLNFCKGGSYQRRVQIAGLQHGSGYKWHNNAWRKSGPHTPGTHFKTYIIRKEKSRMRQTSYARRRLYATHLKEPQPDKHYGPAALDPVDDIDSTEMKRLYLEKLQEFQKSSEDIKAIELATIGQHDNDLYNTHRSDRLTASQFGMVCKRRITTPCHNHVKQILYKSNFSSADTAYGQQNESIARTIFTETYNKIVRLAGLFIDEEFGFLGASPDGVIENEDAIIEVKCFPSLARSAQDIQTAAREKKNFPLCYLNGTLQINKKHNYYYQVQGQLRVAKMKKCYFICFISPMHPITVLEVYRDQNFICEMVAKLKYFFEKYVLLEIIHRRVPKNSKCLEPTKETEEDDASQ